MAESSLINIDMLSPDQKELAKRYAELSGFGGVVSAVILGREEWDVRPLLLKSGKLFLLRTIPSEATDDQRQLIDLRYLFPRLRQAGLVSGELKTGEAAGRYWVVRPFYKSSLDKASPAAIAEVKERGLISLIGELKKLQSHAFVHGHVCPSNVVLDQNKLHLVDHGFFLHRGRFGFDNSEAPELSLGVSPASDIYGLAKVFEKLFDPTEFSRHKTFLSIMLSKDPQIRPDINEIEAHFLGKSPEPLQASSSESAHIGKLLSPDITSSANPSGKIISANSQEPKGAQPLKGVPLWLVLGFFALIILYMGKGYFSFTSESIEDSSTLVVEMPSPEQKSFAESWVGGSKQDKASVVTAAVSDNSLEAQRAILMAAAKKVSPKGVRENLILRAFDPRWAKELSQNDRRNVFTLAAGEFLSEDQRKTSNLSDLHPGVILSVVSTIPINSKSRQISEVKLSTLKQLPKPLGLSFDVLSKEGFETFESKIPRAFAHLIVGDVTPSLIKNFLINEKTTKSKRLSRLLLLMPHLDKEAANLIWNEINAVKSEDKLYRYAKWFSEGSLVDWSKVEASHKLKLMLGAWPSGDFSIEHLCDLLTFFDDRISGKAADFLSTGRKNSALEAVTKLITQKKILLERSQAGSLALALSLSEKASHLFLSKWFSFKPKAEVVLTLLKAVKNKTGSERISIEAARYLSRLDWKPTRDALVMLSNHSEPLVRAIAYSKLDVDNSQERLILEKRRALEKDKGLKKRLAEKLAL